MPRPNHRRRNCITHPLQRRPSPSGSSRHRMLPRRPSRSACLPGIFRSASSRYSCPGCCPLLRRAISFSEAGTGGMARYPGCRRLPGCWTRTCCGSPQSYRRSKGLSCRRASLGLGRPGQVQVVLVAVGPEPAYDLSSSLPSAAALALFPATCHDAGRNPERIHRQHTGTTVGSNTGLACVAVIVRALRDARITLGIYGHVVGNQQRDAVEHRSARIAKYGVN